MSMQKSLDMARTVMEALNTTEGKEMLKPMFAKAYADGKIKTQADFEKMRDDFVMSVIASTPELLHIVAEDVWNANS